VRALAALDVDIVVLLRAGYTEQAWGEVTERLRAPDSALQLRAVLTNGAVYAMQTNEQPWATLRARVPPGASVLVSGVEPQDPTFLDRALVTHALGDRYIRGTLRTGWTSESNPPAPGERFDFGLFALGESIPTEYDSTPLWTDGTLGLFPAR
jgi:hypothetical protein